MKTISFDGSIKDHLMRCNGLFCAFNMPEEWHNKNELPPYSQRVPFLVDEYPACPDNWMPSEGRSKSYMIPVREGYGMWLDFNRNFEHTHHVAVVISIQGVNPLTGKACDKLKLEQYKDECPVHKKPFGPDRFCDHEECGFHWPKQNYICTNATPYGSFWLDGFRAADGLIQQYIITAEKLKGVAANVKDVGSKRVYAIGLGFYLSKVAKPKSTRDYYPIGNILSNSSSSNGKINKKFKKYNSNNITRSEDVPNDIIVGEKICDDNVNVQHQFFSPVHTTTNWHQHNHDLKQQSYVDRDMNEIENNITQSQLVEDTKRAKKLVEKYSSIIGAGAACDDFLDVPISKTTKDITANCALEQNVQKVDPKKLEIGYGSSIKQKIHSDPEELTFWRDKPEAIIYINYVSEEDASNIIEQGRVKIKTKPKGFMENIPAAV